MHGETPLAQKYAIYCRKSTDEAEKQARSVEDQISECLELADRQGLNVPGKPIIEKQSAKMPGCRPLFTKLLKSIAAGEIDGIIAWHPDRLARNMKEGGEVIHLINMRKLVDLKFVSHPFSNDPSGRLLLAIAFAMASQYSEQLSLNVQRGNKHNLLEGKSGGHFKHGYIRDASGFYRPDGNNYELIKKAWQLRLKNLSYEKILEWLNKEGYVRTLKKKKSKLKQIQPMSKQKLVGLFKDPIYYGVLEQSSSKVVLSEHYDFKPMITEDEYYEVQRFNARGHEMPKEKVKLHFPLRGLLKCNECQKPCYAGASKSRNGERYLYYRCHQKGCSNYGKGIRAKIVFLAIEEQLAKRINLSRVEFQKYVSRFKEREQIEIQKRKHQLDRLLGTRKHIEREHSRLTDELMARSEDITEKMRTKRLTAIRQLEFDLSKIEAEIKENKEQTTTSLMRYEDFLNLLKNASTYWQKADHLKKSQIAHLFILNLITDFEDIVEIRLQPPFEVMKSPYDVQLGGPGWT